MFNQNYPLCTSFPNQVYKFIQSLLNLENSSATKKNLVDIFDYKLYSLSFANWGDLSLTRALLSTLFQNPGGAGGVVSVVWTDGRTDNVRKSSCLILYLGFMQFCHNFKFVVPLCVFFAKSLSQKISRLFATLCRCSLLRCLQLTSRSVVVCCVVRCFFSELQVCIQILRLF